MTAIIQIKNNERDNATELWIDYQFIDSWSLFEIPNGLESRITALIRAAIKEGEQRKLREIQRMLGISHT